jgi:hypothetical protein
MVQLGGLEPPTSGSTDRRSNQLSYNCTMLPGGGTAKRAECLANRRALQGFAGKPLKTIKPGRKPGL